MKKRLKKILSDIIPTEDLTYIYNSYDFVGDIAILRLTDASKKYSATIAETVMNLHKNVKTILAQTSPVHGDFRVRKLEYVAGENKTTTIHKESKCMFSVDVEKCYFSPRLFYERMRIAKLVEYDEIILNMFAGVGCFSVIVAKHSNAKKVYSIDVNSLAIHHMQENVRLNGVYGRVIPMFGDAKEVIEKRLCHVADRVLMPLPEKALEYLPYALVALKEVGGWIHYYDFAHAKQDENPMEKVKSKVAEKLRSLVGDFKIPFGHFVRSTGPNWYQVVLDIKANPRGNPKL